MAGWINRQLRRGQLNPQIVNSHMLEIETTRPWTLVHYIVAICYVTCL